MKTKTIMLFECTLKDQKVLATFIKACEAIFPHSDTALFKVTEEKGIHILLTDFESFCISDLAMKSIPFALTVKEFSAKILLDSLIKELKQIQKNNRAAVLFAKEEHPHILQLKEMSVNIKKQFGDDKFIESTEQRTRYYHNLTIAHFCKSDYIHLQLLNGEFLKIINACCIFSGTDGRDAYLSATKSDDHEVLVKFTIQNNNGVLGLLCIRTGIGYADAPVIEEMKASAVKSKFLLTYMKRSQGLLSVATEFTDIYLSEKGILLKAHDTYSETMVYMADVTGENLETYA